MPPCHDTTGDLCLRLGLHDDPVVRPNFLCPVGNPLSIWAQQRLPALSCCCKSLLSFLIETPIKVWAGAADDTVHRHWLQVYPAVPTECDTITATSPSPFPPTFLVCSLSDMLNEHAERLERSLQQGGIRNVCVRKELGNHGEMCAQPALGLMDCTRRRRHCFRTRKPAFP